MKLINPDDINWRCTGHGVPCIYPEDIEALGKIDAIPIDNIKEAIRKIESLKGDNFPNTYYINIFKEVIKNESYSINGSSSIKKN